MADDVPFSKISISGPTLSSLLQRFSSSPSNLDGLLFGHVTHLSIPFISDDSPFSTSASLPSPPSITITSFLSSPSPLSPFFPPPNPNHNSPQNLIGWFSARRHSPLRPSMRELSLSSILSKSLTLDHRSCVFLLLSSFTTPNNAVHTHEYRAYVLSGRSKLCPLSIDVINVGPAFRGQYESFSPESSAFPLMRMPRGGEGEVNGREETEWSVEGFGVERMEGLVGKKAVEYTAELEEMYRKILGKLEGLARQVEKSSARVLDQVSNMSFGLITILESVAKKQ